MVADHSQGIDGQLGGQFYLAHRYARAATNHRLRGLGIDLRHLGVLADLAEHGPSKQRDLVERTQMDKSSLVYVIDALEHRELAQRHRDDHDRRSYAVRLTTDGANLLQTANEIVNQAMGQVLAGLTRVEKDQLHGLLNKFLGSLSATEPAPKSSLPENPTSTNAGSRCKD